MATIITIMSDGSRAHAYRTLEELVGTQKPLPAGKLLFFDAKGFTLVPTFGATGQLIALTPDGTADPAVLLAQLRAVIDQAVLRVPQDPASMAEFGVTHQDALATLAALRLLDLDDLLGQTSELLDPVRTGLAVARPLNGPVPHGSWVHRVLFH